MRTVTVSQFKAHALSILKGIAETGEKIIVTKHGKPLAIVSPYGDAGTQREEGKLQGTIIEEHDLTANLDLLMGGEIEA